MKRMAIWFAVLAAASPAMADVRIASATDATHGSVIERAQNTATLRRTLDRLTSRLSTKTTHVDATIVSLTVEPQDDLVVVSARVRLAISDDNGRILSVITGGAKVEQDARIFRTRHLKTMRADAVSGAVEGMFDKVKLATR